MVTLIVPYWALALVAVVVITWIGHAVGGRYQEPRNNAGGIYGFILALLVVGLCWALFSGLTALAVGLALVAGMWLMIALGSLGVL